MHAEQASSSGLGGGGGNRLPVEFPQVQTSNYYFILSSVRVIEF